jgi:hypothetical protein
MRSYAQLPSLHATGSLAVKCPPYCSAALHSSVAGTSSQHAELPAGQHLPLISHRSSPAAHPLAPGQVARSVTHWPFGHCSVLAGHVTAAHAFCSNKHDPSGHLVRPGGHLSVTAHLSRLTTQVKSGQRTGRSGEQNSSRRQRTRDGWHVPSGHWNGESAGQARSGGQSSFLALHVPS